MGKRRQIDPFSALMEIAQAHQGYFTTRQAIAAGYADNTHTYHVRTGNWERVQRGIYRLRAIKAGRSPILLTERTSQVDEFATRLVGLVKNIVVLKGGMGVKQRRAIAEQLMAIPDGEERVLLAIGRYIGEGFDDARLVHCNM